MKKIIMTLIILAVVLIIAQPIINKDTNPISNIDELENIENIKKITVQSNDENITLKILVQNDISEEQARARAEKVIRGIDIDKKIVFSLLYEHGYLIGQGTVEAGEQIIQWN